MSKHSPHIIKQREIVAAKLGPDKVPSEWDAFGHPVPPYRKQNAFEHYRDMNPDVPTGVATTHIAYIADKIERDEVFEAEAYWRREMCGTWLDLTGYYRLLSVLVTG
jgi:hypothetical protein